MKESWRYKKVKRYKCGQIGHPSFVCYKEEKRRCQDEEGKQEHVVYYCLEQVDEEKQEVLE